MAAIHVTAENFKEVVLEAKGTVLVDFWAQWCGPCQMMGPIVEEIAEEYPDLKVCKLDIDNAMEIAKEYHVMSIPTFLVFENGAVVKRTIGEQSKQELLSVVGK